VVLSSTKPASSIRTAKVLVWDLDDTLWEGVLAEDGISGIRLKPEAERAVRTLDERGVVQTIASKNDYAEAMAALEHFRLAEFFLHPEINYEPKSRSVAAQATRLGLDLDSFVFIDDQPFERAEVRGALPAVRTLAEDQLKGLLKHPWFDLPVTPESRRRRSLYMEEASRVVALETAGADYTAFLRTSDLRLDISPLALADVERVFDEQTN
jgi:FkbH-like protein